MRIEIEKKGNGASVLRCTRRDGSVTFQRHEGKQGTFYPIHDLTHLAVESELSRPEGFFSLVASGWELEETTGKGARGPIPEDAVAVEKLVGLLDLERAGVLETRRGIGTSVRASAAEARPRDEHRRRLSAFVTRMLADAARSGFTYEELRDQLDSLGKEGD